MTEVLGQAVLDVTADLSDLRRELAEGEQQTDRSMSAMSRDVDDFGVHLGAVGKSVRDTFERPILEAFREVQLGAGQLDLSLAAVTGQVRELARATIGLTAIVMTSSHEQVAAIDDVSAAYIRQAAAARLAAAAAGIGPGRIDRPASPGLISQMSGGTEAQLMSLLAERKAAGFVGRPSPTTSPADAYLRQIMRELDPNVLSRMTQRAGEPNWMRLTGGPERGWTGTAEPSRNLPVPWQHGGPIEVRDTSLEQDFKMMAAYARSGGPSGSWRPPVAVGGGGGSDWMPPLYGGGGGGGGGDGGGGFFGGAFGRGGGGRDFLGTAFGSLAGGRMGRGLLGRFGIPFFGAPFMSALDLMGFGKERLPMAGLSLGGFAGQGLMGGGLLGAGMLGQMAVGGGSDMAVMKSTIGDTQQLFQSYHQLTTAVAVYGAHSRQAAVAQKQLNDQMDTLGPASKYELGLAKRVTALDTFWDKATVGARIQAIHVLDQVVHLGQDYVPRVAAAAQHNLGIINTGLKPLFAWLEGPQGKGVFDNLERDFAKNLPTAVHAFTQAVELVLKIVSDAAAHTGGFTKSLDHFFTRWNEKPSNVLRDWVDKLIGDFRQWEHFAKALFDVVRDLFKQDAGTGQGIVATLTQMLEKLDAWERSTSGKGQLHNIFEAHKEQLLALLQVIPEVARGFGSIYLALAPLMTRATIPLIGAVVDLMKAIEGLGQGPTIALGVLLTSMKLFGIGSTFNGIKTAAMWLLGLESASDKAAAAATRNAAAQREAAVAMQGEAAAAEEAAVAEARSAGGVVLPGGMPAAREAEMAAKETETSLKSTIGKFAQKAAWAGVGVMAAQTIGSSVHGGLGKAISDVGTGASLGMMFGPWGAALGGALGGAVALLSHSDHTKRDGEEFARNFTAPLGSAVASQFGKQIAQTRSAMRKIESAPSDIVGAMSSGDQRKLANVYRQLGSQLGREQGQAMVSAMQNVHGPKDASAYAFIQDISHVMQQVPKGMRDPQAIANWRNSAARGILEYASTLEKNGQLPKRAVDGIIKGIEAQFPQLRTYLHEQGLESSKEWAGALNFEAASSKLHASFQAIRQQFMLFNVDPNVTGANWVKNVGNEAYQLERIMKTAHGRVRDDAITAWKQLRTETGAVFDTMVHDLKSKQGALYDAIHSPIAGASKKAATEAADNLTNFENNVYQAMKSGAMSASQGSSLLHKALQTTLSAFGSKTSLPHDVQIAVDAIQHPTALTKLAGFLARGGLLQVGRPGEAGHDTVPLSIGGQDMVVGPGEQIAVLNRHHQPIINRALRRDGYAGLAGLFDDVRTPNYMARGGFAKGGHVKAPLDPNTWQGLDVHVKGDGTIPELVRSYMDDAIGPINDWLNTAIWNSGPPASGGHRRSKPHHRARGGFVGMALGGLRPALRTTRLRSRKPSKGSSLKGLSTHLDDLFGMGDSGLGLIGDVQNLDQTLEHLSNWQGYIQSLHQRIPPESIVTLADGTQVVNWDGMVDPSVGHFVPGINARLAQIGDPGSNPNQTATRDLSTELGIDETMLDDLLKERTDALQIKQQWPAWLTQAAQHNRAIKAYTADISSLMNLRDQLGSAHTSEDAAITRRFLLARHNVRNAAASARFSASEILHQQLSAVTSGENIAEARIPTTPPYDFFGDRQTWTSSREMDRALTRNEYQGRRSAIEAATRAKNFAGMIARSDALTELSIQENAEKSALTLAFEHRRTAYASKLREDRADLANENKWRGALTRAVAPGGFGDRLSDLTDPRGALMINILTKENIDIPNLLQEIADLQNSTAQLASTTTSTGTGSPSTAGDASAALQAANQALLVSQAQYQVLRELPEYAGTFALGGIVPGPIGEPRTVIAHGGEKITPPGGEPNINFVISGKDAWLRNLIDVRIERSTRTMARRSSRTLAGRGGGLLG